MKPLYMQDFKRQDHVSIVGEMHEMRTSRGQSRARDTSALY